MHKIETSTSKILLVFPVLGQRASLLVFSCKFLFSRVLISSKKQCGVKSQGLAPRFANTPRDPGRTKFGLGGGGAEWAQLELTDAKRLQKMG